MTVNCVEEFICVIGASENWNSGGNDRVLVPMSCPTESPDVLATAKFIVPLFGRFALVIDIVPVDARLSALMPPAEGSARLNSDPGVNPMMDALAPADGVHVTLTFPTQVLCT